jgi:hypothetical protein
VSVLQQIVGARRAAVREAVEQAWRRQQPLTPRGSLTHLGVRLTGSTAACPPPGPQPDAIAAREPAAVRMLDRTGVTAKEGAS